MAKVTPTIPEIALPSASAILPEKFTRRGTMAIAAWDGACDWAFSAQQDSETTSNNDSEHLRDFIAHLILMLFVHSVFFTFPRLPHRARSMAYAAICKPAICSSAYSPEHQEAFAEQASARHGEPPQSISRAAHRKVQDADKG